MVVSNPVKNSKFNDLLEMSAYIPSRKFGLAPRINPPNQPDLPAQLTFNQDLSCISQGV
jgi:hypothetical protein